MSTSDPSQSAIAVDPAGVPPSPGPAAPRGRRLVAFVLLTYGLAWAWWVPLAVRGITIGPGQGWPTHLPGLLAPAIAAVVVTAATTGRAGLLELWSRVIRWRVGWGWYLLIGVTAAMAFAPALLGRGLVAADLLSYSGAPAAGVWVVAYVLLVNGFGEEVGWRGYLAEGLLARHSRGVTALVVWLVWAGWHLPLFWVVDNFRDLGAVGTIGWSVGIGCGSLFLTWLYACARHSILVVALWHTAYNFTTATAASAGVAAAVSSTLVMATSLVIALLPGTWRRGGSPALRASGGPAPSG